MDRKEALRKLASNPYYRLSPAQEAELNIITQEIRNDDINVVAPKMRRKKRVTANEIRRDSLSKENIHS